VAQKSLKNNRLVLATHNRHKVREIQAILKKEGLKIRILTLDAFPSIKPIRENKPTIEGNAIKKAAIIAEKTGLPALADDTGLFVRALNGAPGVISARFAGPRCRYEDNNRKLLRLLKNVPWPRRGAEFRCVAALAAPEGRTLLIKGKVAGKITFKPKGKKGFGYDPVFLVQKYQKTFGEMSTYLKNKISHRAIAFASLASHLKKGDWGNAGN